MSLSPLAALRNSMVLLTETVGCSFTCQAEVGKGKNRPAHDAALGVVVNPLERHLANGVAACCFDDGAARGLRGELVIGEELANLINGGVYGEHGRPFFRTRGVRQKRPPMLVEGRVMSCAGYSAGVAMVPNSSSHSPFSTVMVCVLPRSRGLESVMESSSKSRSFMT